MTVSMSSIAKVVSASILFRIEEAEMIVIRAMQAGGKQVDCGSLD